jgi:F0F1-type ATP synthase membrane subunit b/b'
MKLLLSSLTLIVASSVAFAAEPVQNVSANKHPNLAEAQHHAEMAYNKITDAQKANEFDMNGHAAKAKDLLDQVNKELKQAAEAANKNKK